MMLVVGAGAGLSLCSAFLAVALRHEVVGGGAYAEWLPRLHAEEAIEPGDVVGLFGDRVTRVTRRADGVTVVTDASRVSSDGWRGGVSRLHERVALVGTVGVRVAGPVARGDYLVASGRNNGTAVGVRRHALTPEQVVRVVGRSLESSATGQVRKVRALVGVADSAPLAALLAAKERRIWALEEELHGYSARLDVLEARSESGATRMATTGSR